MSDQQCSHESAVRCALDEGRLTEDLRRHASECASCNEAVQVARFMKGVARAMQRGAMPDAHAMWARIQLEERRTLAERAQRPIRLALMFAKCWFACVAAVVLYREWPVIGNLVTTMPEYVWIAIAAGAAIYAKGRGVLKGFGMRSPGSA